MIDPSKPPDSVQVMQLFLQNGSASLRDSGCVGIADLDARLTLRDRLAQVLGESAGLPNRKSVIEVSCIADKTDAIPGRLLDAWACTVRTVELDEQGEYVADGSVRAHFTKDTWSFVPGTIMCL